MQISFEAMREYSRATDAAAALRKAHDGGSDYFAIEARNRRTIEGSTIGDFVRNFAAKADEREAIGRRNEETMRSLGRR